MGARTIAVRPGWGKVSVDGVGVLIWEQRKLRKPMAEAVRSTVWVRVQRAATEAVLRRRDQAKRDGGGVGRRDQDLRSSVEHCVVDIKVSYVNYALVAA